jgi:hypothetical protein
MQDIACPDAMLMTTAVQNKTKALSKGVFLN